jgi:lysophospholipase L1-like esterase
MALHRSGPWLHATLVAAAASARRLGWLWRPALISIVLLTLYDRGPVQAGGRAAVARVVYVALGDGTTNGDGGAGPFDGCYPALLARHLPRGAHFLNLASAANPLSSALVTDLPAALAAHPTLVTVWLGLVDLAYGSDTPPATYQADLDTLLTALQRTHARIFIANLPDLRLFHDADSPHQATNGLAYNAIIAAEARRHGAVVVDVYAISKSIWGNPAMLAGEGYDVPNAQGQAVLASLFYSAMHSQGAI